MKLHLLTIAALMSVPAQAMENGKGEFIVGAIIMEEHDAEGCTCKEREIKERHKKYEASVLENFDETCFAPMETH